MKFFLHQIFIQSLKFEILLSARVSNHKTAESEQSFSIKVGSEVEVGLVFPPQYPATAPPTYSLSAPRLSAAEKTDLSATLEQLYLDNRGECVVFLWTEELRTFLHNRNLCDNNDTIPVIGDESVVENISFALEKSRLELCPDIVTGEILEDRKSVFQGHTACVKSQEEVQQVLKKLYTNKKIAQATHNISAYRIYLPEKKSWLADCDDDGEDAGGGRLLHLLEILDVTDRVVVVSRWFGGVKLGPDRFKLINNAARLVLKSAVTDLGGKEEKNKKKKKR